METIINKYNRIIHVLGFHYKLLHILLISKRNAILNATVECVGTDYIIYCYLPVRAKNGKALLPCIFELSVR